MTAPAQVATPAPIRVFLIDDHELVRRGLSEIIRAAGDMTVVGEAGTVAEALVEIPKAAPDVALLDVRLPDGTGIEVCREIRSSYPEINCLFLTSFDDDEALFAAVLAGAAGFVLKQIRGHNLVEGIRKVAQGQSLLDPTEAKEVRDSFRDPGAPSESAPTRGLVSSEREILRMIADGCTNHKIAAQLSLSEDDVNSYITAIFLEVGVVRRSPVDSAGLPPGGPADRP